MGKIVSYCCPDPQKKINPVETSSDLITTIKTDADIHFAAQQSQNIFRKKKGPFKTRKQIPKISAGEAQYQNYIAAYNQALQTNSLSLVNLLKLCIDNSPQITSYGQNKQTSLTQLKYTQPKELVNAKCLIYLFNCEFAYQLNKKLTKQKYKQILKATGMAKKICQPFCKPNPQKIVFKGGRCQNLHRGLDGIVDVQVGQVIQQKGFSSTYAYSNRLQDVRNSRYFYSFQLDSEDPHHYMIPKEEYTENNQQQIIVFPFITLQVVEKTIQKDFGRYILKQVKPSE